MESYTHLADHVSVRSPSPGARRSRKIDPADGRTIERPRPIETVREIPTAEPVADVLPREPPIA